MQLLALTSHENVVKLHRCVSWAFQSHSFRFLYHPSSASSRVVSVQKMFRSAFSLLVFLAGKQRNQNEGPWAARVPRCPEVGGEVHSCQFQVLLCSQLQQVSKLSVCVDFVKRKKMRRVRIYSTPKGGSGALLAGWLVKAFLRRVY